MQFIVYKECNCSSPTELILRSYLFTFFLYGEEELLFLLIISWITIKLTLKD